jgi:phosphatidylglycerophosphate synthase
MVDKEDTPVMPAADSPRDKDFLLAATEQRVLHAIAERLPARVLPDHLTALGILAALGIAAAYVLSNERPAWLLVATALLVVHWLGDSLDGTLARVRRIERPTYGYYLDHLVDGLATAAIGIGLGLSPHMLLATGLIIVIAYLLLSINTYLETSAFGVFRLGYGRIGPTEARLGLAAVNLAMFAGLALDATVLGVGVTVLDLAGLVVAAGMLVALLVRASHNLRVLAEREPAGVAR